MDRQNNMTFYKFTCFKVDKNLGITFKYKEILMREN